MAEHLASENTVEQGKMPGTLDDAAVLARFAADETDVAGLIAYSLHRRALLAFRRDFEARHARPVTQAEESVFLIGEVSDARIAAYRAHAAAMTGQSGTGQSGPQPAPSRPRRKARWPWFGMWVDAPMAPNGEPEKINWKGLFLRLLVLLLAVVTTAVLLRILVVKS